LGDANYGIGFLKRMGLPGFSELRLNESWGIMVNYDYNNKP
jgi:hypothetical protein